MRPRAVEIEWQFAVRDLGAFRRSLAPTRRGAWSIEPAGVVRLRDAYYDTEDWRVARAGYALRVRRAADEIEATLKALARARRGAARRREISSPLRTARVTALLTARGPLAARVRTIVAGAPLRRLFGVQTRREVLAVRHAGRVVAELALDRTRIAAGTRRRELTRVEVEVKAGPPALVARFVGTLRRGRQLTPARRSKFEEGMATAKLHPVAGFGVSRR